MAAPEALADPDADALEAGEPPFSVLSSTARAGGKTALLDAVGAADEVGTAWRPVDLSMAPRRR